MTQMSVIDRLAQFADPHTGLTADKMPAHIWKINAWQTISMLAAILHGKKSKYYTKLKKPAGDAVSCATYLATMAMFYDFDDFMFAGHTGHSSVVLPLVLASDFPVSGKEFQALQTLGNEAGGRLGASVFFGPHNGQMWSSIHQFNAGLILGRLKAQKSGDATVIRETLSRAMAYPCFALFDSFFSSSAKIFTASSSLGAGLSAALAADGVAGPDFLKADSDFYRVFSYVPLLQVWDDLGEKWYSQSISIKKYPGCAFIGGPVEACRTLQKEMMREKFSIADIARVEVECNMLSKKMNDLSKPYLNGAESSMTTLNFSLPINCATMLADGNITPESFSAESLARSEVWELAEKIGVEHDLEATRVMMKYTSLIKDSGTLVLKNLHRLGPYVNRMGGFADAFQIPFEAGINFFRKSRYSTESLVLPDDDFSRFTFINPATVTVKFKSGKKLSASSLYPPGFAGTTEAEMTETVMEKLTTSGISDAGAKKIRDFAFNPQDLTPAEIKTFSNWFMNQL
jgi:2-methylcitrate dehydratase PrpD